MRHLWGWAEVRSAEGVFVTGELSSVQDTRVRLVVSRADFWALVRRCQLDPAQVLLLRAITADRDLADAADACGMTHRRAKRLFDDALVRLAEVAATLDIQVAQDEAAQVAEVMALEAARSAGPVAVFHCPTGREKCAVTGVCAARDYREQRPLAEIGLAGE